MTRNASLGCRLALLALAVAAAAGCRANEPAPPASQASVGQRPHDLILVTIDTLRADRVGVYGHAQARTPMIDALARRGVRFSSAFAPTPITLPSHASLLTGRYPPGHHARHNGMRVDAHVPSLAATLAAAGFATGGFVGAFPLDRRFGLNAGFAAYGDRMPRSAQGRLANERAGSDVADEAIGWLRANAGSRRFLWMHLFEPHAPYGDARSGRPASDRYDDEVAEADRQVGRVLEALGEAASRALVVVTADHGEAFGEHGELTHSLFVYDTTLRVPLVIAGPGVPAAVRDAPVTLVDIAPTVLPLLGVKAFDSDGIDLARVIAGEAGPERELYAESFAALLDFGWSPLRAVRAGRMKYIAAPREELYDLAADPGETTDRASAEPQRTAALRDRVDRYSPASLAAPAVDPDALARLRALGYASGSGGTAATRADPKDRKELAAALAQVTSGELQGAALETALRQILAQDRGNNLARIRLGFVLLESKRCAGAVPLFTDAIASGAPGADPHLGLALCQLQARQTEAAAATLAAADRAEPENPVVLANLGIVSSDAGRHAEGIAALEKALAIDPGFHEARFNLARVLARSGRPSDAAAQARELLTRLPTDAPQRAEVARLLDAVK